MFPLVSIVVISYNHERYIRKALDSILMQNTNFDIEIIIGDDCSQDNTQELILDYCKRYPKVIKSVLRKENVGPTNNIYDLYTKCKGKYIAILEGDDFWITSEKLQKQVDILENNSQYIAVAHKRIVVDSNDVVLSDFIDKTEENFKPIYSINDFTKDGFGFSSSTIMMRNIFMKSEDLYKDIYTSSRFIGDYVLNYLLLDKGDVMILDENLSAWRFFHTENDTNFNSLARKFPFEHAVDRLGMLLKVKEFFNGRYNLEKELIAQTTDLLIILIKRNKLKNIEEFQEIISKLNKIELMLAISYVPVQSYKIIKRRLQIKLKLI